MDKLVRRKWDGVRWILLLTIGISFAVHTIGVRQNLPYTPEVDEPIFVRAAVNIASSGDWNPRWFGNPGSTVIYPLAILFRVWFAVTHRGMFFHPDPSLQVVFEANPSEFYLLGRLLTILYAVITVPLVYKLGGSVFGRYVGLMGAWLSVFSPLAVAHARMVRTDSAAAFYGVLGLWFCMKLFERPNVVRQAMAGLAIGLAVATRYFMVTLAAVLLAVDGLLAWRHRPFTSSRVYLLLSIFVGFAAIGLGFMLSTPYFTFSWTSAPQCRT